MVIFFFNLSLILTTAFNQDGKTKTSTRLDDAEGEILEKGLTRTQV